MKKENIIHAKGESHFLQVQAQLEGAGYSLIDYNEYFETETWANGNHIVTIQLEED